MDPHLATALTMARAGILAKLRRYDESDALASKTLHELESLDAPNRVLAEAHSSLGAINWERAEPEQALQSWTLALKLREGEDAESRRFRARMAFNQGLVLPVLGRSEERSRQVELALEQEANMSDQLGRRHGLCIERLHTLEGLADAELGVQVRAECERRASALGEVQGSPARAVVDDAAK